MGHKRKRKILLGKQTISTKHITDDEKKNAMIINLHINHSSRGLSIVQKSLYTSNINLAANVYMEG